MGEKTVDGLQAMKVWSRRRLDDWEDDVRHNDEDQPPLVFHLVVEPPTRNKREGHSKAWPMLLRCTTVHRAQLIK